MAAQTPFPLSWLQVLGNFIFSFSISSLFSCSVRLECAYNSSGEQSSVWFSYFPKASIMFFLYFSGFCIWECHIKSASKLGTIISWGQVLHIQRNLMQEWKEVLKFRILYGNSVTNLCWRRHAAISHSFLAVPKLKSRGCSLCTAQTAHRSMFSWSKLTLSWRYMETAFSNRGVLSANSLVSFAQVTTSRQREQRPQSFLVMMGWKFPQQVLLQLAQSPIFAKYYQVYLQEQMISRTRLQKTLVF